MDSRRCRLPGADDDYVTITVGDGSVWCGNEQLTYIGISVCGERHERWWSDARRVYVDIYSKYIDIRSAREVTAKGGTAHMVCNGGKLSLVWGGGVGRYMLKNKYRNYVKWMGSAMHHLAFCYRDDGCIDVITFTWFKCDGRTSLYISTLIPGTVAAGYWIGQPIGDGLIVAAFYVNDDGRVLATKTVKTGVIGVGNVPMTQRVTPGIVVLTAGDAIFNVLDLATEIVRTYPLLDYVRSVGEDICEQLPASICPSVLDLCDGDAIIESNGRTNITITQTVEIGVIESRYKINTECRSELDRMARDASSYMSLLPRDILDIIICKVEDWQLYYRAVHH